MEMMHVNLVQVHAVLCQGTSSLLVVSVARARTPGHVRVLPGVGPRGHGEEGAVLGERVEGVEHLDLRRNRMLEVMGAEHEWEAQHE